MLFDKVGIELQINPSWYNPLLGALERKDHQYIRKLPR